MNLKPPTRPIHPQAFHHSLELQALSELCSLPQLEKPVCQFKQFLEMEFEAFADICYLPEIEAALQQSGLQQPAFYLSRSVSVAFSLSLLLNILEPHQTVPEKSSGYATFMLAQIFPEHSAKAPHFLTNWPRHIQHYPQQALNAFATAYKHSMQNLPAGLSQIDAWRNTQQYHTVATIRNEISHWNTRIWQPKKHSPPNISPVLTTIFNPHQHHGTSLASHSHDFLTETLQAHRELSLLVQESQTRLKEVLATLPSECKLIAPKTFARSLPQEAYPQTLALYHYLLAQAEVAQQYLDTTIALLPALHTEEANGPFNLPQTMHQHVALIRQDLQSQVEVTQEYLEHLAQILPPIAYTLAAAVKEMLPNIPQSGAPHAAYLQQILLAQISASEKSLDTLKQLMTLPQDMPFHHPALSQQAFAQTLCLKQALDSQIQHANRHWLAWMEQTATLQTQLSNGPSLLAHTLPLVLTTQASRFHQTLLAQTALSEAHLHTLLTVLPNLHQPDDSLNTPARLTEALLAQAQQLHQSLLVATESSQHHLTDIMQTLAHCQHPIDGLAQSLQILPQKAQAHVHALQKALVALAETTQQHANSLASLPWLNMPKTANILASTFPEELLNQANQLHKMLEVEAKHTHNYLQGLAAQMPLFTEAMDYLVHHTGETLLTVDEHHILPLKAQLLAYSHQANQYGHQLQNCVAFMRQSASASTNSSPLPQAIFTQASHWHQTLVAQAALGQAHLSAANQGLRSFNQSLAETTRTLAQSLPKSASHEIPALAEALVTQAETTRRYAARLQQSIPSLTPPPDEQSPAKALPKHVLETAAQWQQTLVAQTETPEEPLQALSQRAPLYVANMVQNTWRHLNEVLPDAKKGDVLEKKLLAQLQASEHVLDTLTQALPPSPPLVDTNSSAPLLPEMLLAETAELHQLLIQQTERYTDHLSLLKQTLPDWAGPFAATTDTLAQTVSEQAQDTFSHLNPILISQASTTMQPGFSFVKWSQAVPTKLLQPQQQAPIPTQNIPQVALQQTAELSQQAIAHVDELKAPLIPLAETVAELAEASIIEETTLAEAALPASPIIDTAATPIPDLLIPIESQSVIPLKYPMAIQPPTTPISNGMIAACLDTSGLQADLPPEPELIAEADAPAILGMPAAHEPNGPVSVPAAEPIKRPALSQLAQAPLPQSPDLPISQVIATAPSQPRLPKKYGSLARLGWLPKDPSPSKPPITQPISLMATSHADNEPIKPTTATQSNASSDATDRIFGVSLAESVPLQSTPILMASDNQDKQTAKTTNLVLGPSDPQKPGVASAQQPTRAPQVTDTRLTLTPAPEPADRPHREQSEAPSAKAEAPHATGNAHFSPSPLTTQPASTPEPTLEKPPIPPAQVTELPQTIAQAHHNSLTTDPAAKPSAPALVSLKINNGLTLDTEVIEWPDGGISIPMAAFVKLFDIVPQQSLETSTLSFTDPVTQKHILVDWNKQLVQIGDRSITELPHTIVPVENGFVVENDIYVDKSILEAIFQTTLSYDKDNLVLNVKTDRKVRSSRLASEAAKGENMDWDKLQEIVIDDPETINSWVDRIYLNTSNRFMYRITEPPAVRAATQGNTYFHTLGNSLTMGLRGTILGQEYFIKPTFVNLNGNVNIRTLDWGIRHETKDHEWYMGNMNAGLSPLVSPNLPLWGLRFASLNALKPKIQFPTRRQFSGKTKQNGEVILVLNQKQQTTVASNQGEYNFEPISLKPNTVNEVKIVEKDENDTETVLHEETVAIFDKLLPKGEKAYSVFLGRVPVQFYPVVATKDTPIFLKQSNKWAAGGRYYYGLTNRLMLGVSTAGDMIFGEARTPSLLSGLFNQLYPDLTGNTSYRRDPNFYHGVNIGTSLRYQLTNTISLTSELGGSYRQTKPGYTLPLPDKAFAKAAEVELAYKKANFSTGISLFHYDTNYYTPITLANNNLYDRQGLRLRANGTLDFLKLRYNMRFENYQSNLDEIIPGGLIHAKRWVGNISKDITKRTSLSLDYNWLNGDNDNREFTQRLTDLTLRSRLPHNMGLEVKLSQFSTSNAIFPYFAPNQPAVLQFSEQKFENTILESTLNIPFAKQKYLKYIKLGSRVSDVLNYSYIQGGIAYKNFFIEPLIQLSYGSIQMQNRLGAKVSYQFKNGRRIGFSYYYGLDQFALKKTATPPNTLHTHQFFVDFADIIGAIGDQFKSLGPGSDNMGILTGTVYLDLNQNGVRDAKEPGMQNISMQLDGHVRIKTNDKGVFVINDLRPGYHTLDPVFEDLPLNVAAPSATYKIRIRPGKTQKLDIGLNILNGSISGRVIFEDIQHRPANSEKIMVILMNAAGQVVNYTTANSKGIYRFNNLPPGHYKVDIETRAKDSGKFKMLSTPHEVDIPVDPENPVDKTGLDFQLLKL